MEITFSLNNSLNKVPGFLPLTSAPYSKLHNRLCVYRPHLFAEVWSSTLESVLIDTVALFHLLALNYSSNVINGYKEQLKATDDFV